VVIRIAPTMNRTGVMKKNFSTQMSTKTTFSTDATSSTRPNRRKIFRWTASPVRMQRNEMALQKTVRTTWKLSSMPQDSFSDNIREKTNQWYGHTLYSRLNDKNRGKIIVIMQRIHDDDFTGYLLSSDPTFRQVKIQAIAGKDEEWRIKDRLRNKERVSKNRYLLT